MMKPKTLASCAVVLFLLLLLFLLVNGRRDIPEPISANYRPVVCEASWAAPSVDMGGSAERTFVVKLHEGCFREAVILPKAWRTWRFELDGVDGGKGCWFAVWPSGHDPMAPLQAGKSKMQIPADSMRLQGTEGCTMRFFDAEWK